MTTSGSERSEATTFWEDFYRDKEQVWSGDPNAVLAHEAASLTPGTALDLGCGEGGDAIWLAGRGWDVTSVDISDTALQRAAARADAVGVSDRITWQRHDLGRSFPDGTFDLVSAQYLHSPVELPNAQILRAAAGAVSPGGTLLIVGHGAFPPWAHDHDHHHGPAVHFPAPEENLADLELPADLWDVTRCESVERQAKGPDGRSGTLLDSILMLRRLDP